MGSIEHAVSVLRELSPPLAVTLEKHPELLGEMEPGASVTLRHRASLIDVALSDAAGTATLAELTRRLSDAVDQLVAEELASAVASAAASHPVAADLPFAVIAMGKWGAQELNYYSDIDLVFVHHPAAGAETTARAAAQAVASKLIANLASPTFDGPALNVDADLRPEGSMGPLSRSLDGYAGYYSRWGEPWELQALLKARFVAGDPDLGSKFEALAASVMWEGGLDSDALRSIRLLKERVESGAGPNDIKRSRGGIRDIEFSVQLLQLVHGRFDEDLRVPATLDAIEALATHGYIDPDEASDLSASYQFLRNVEHRLQLAELRQTHTLPTDPELLSRLAENLGFSSVDAFQERLRTVRATARDLHERLYFRPILDSLVGVDQASLDPTQAGIRLEALGYRDVRAAMSAVSELTSGLSRRSRVMHQALPLMLDWLSQSPDPDLGLAQLRLLLANSPDHSSVVSLLQNNPLAGQRLCTLLGTGKLVGDLIDRIPEFIPRLADDSSIGLIRDDKAAEKRLIGLLEVRPGRESRIGTIRRFVRRRKLRIAARDILGGASPQVTVRSLSDSADAAIAGALHTLLDSNDEFGVIAMGKWGGREMSYGSDIDLFYIHGDNQMERGLHLASEMAVVLSEPNRHGDAFELDLDLRPEGRKGPISRSITSFERYYSDWAEPWELLALLKGTTGRGLTGIGGPVPRDLGPCALGGIVSNGDDTGDQIDQGPRRV